MILWSVVPAECVFDGFAEPERQPRLEYVEWRGVTMQVEPVGAGRYRIHRLLSPRPEDYLKPEWAPGAWLDLGGPARD